MKKIMIITAIVFSFGLIRPAFSETLSITPSLIAENNSEMETVLNQNGKVLSTIRYLYNHISNDAVFMVSVNNPSLSIPSDQVFEMNKESYINTYIQGVNFIDQYSFHIETLGIEISSDSKEAATEELLTERGVMVNPYNPDSPGRKFVSSTRCTTLHAIVDGELVSKGGSCHTDVAFEEDI